MDNLYILSRAVDEQIKENRGKAFAFFADLKATFDGLNRTKMIDILKKLDVEKRLLYKIEEIYQETNNVVRENQGDIATFWTTKGIRQECPLSSSLFSLYIADLENILKKAQDGGLILGRKKFLSLCYADDIDMVARDEEQMRAMLETFKKYLTRKELSLNVNKSKVMVFKRKKKPKENMELGRWKKWNILSIWDIY